MKIPTFRLALALVATVTIGGLVAGHSYGLRWNKTASLPPGLYQVTAATPAEIERGSMVMFCPEQSEVQLEARERGYLPWGFACPGGFAPLFKIAMAVPGDVVEATPAGITINGQPVVNSSRLDADSLGRALPPLPTSGEVPPGMVWLLSDYAPRSWDSRYFGPVPVDTVYGLARPVWTVE